MIAYALAYWLRIDISVFFNESLHGQRGRAGAPFHYVIHIRENALLVVLSDFNQMPYQGWRKLVILRQARCAAGIKGVREFITLPAELLDSGFSPE